MSKNRKTEVTKEVAPEVTKEVAPEKLDIEKFKLETGELELSSEEYIKEGLKNILDEVKSNNKLVFQGLFIMYLEDMISKLR